MDLRKTDVVKYDGGRRYPIQTSIPGWWPPGGRVGGSAPSPGSRGTPPAPFGSGRRPESNIFPHRCFWALFLDPLFLRSLRTPPPSTRGILKSSAHPCHASARLRWRWGGGKGGLGLWGVGGGAKPCRFSNPFGKKSTHITTECFRFRVFFGKALYVMIEPCFEPLVYACAKNFNPRLWVNREKTRADKCRWNFRIQSQNLICLR